MIPFGWKGGVIRMITVACALVTGCGGPPRTGMTRHAGTAAPAPSTLVTLDGTVVDVRPDAGMLTVKDLGDYQTWTIAVGRDTHLVGPDRAPVRLADIKIGARVRIEGDSRVTPILDAREIEVIEGVQGP